ncbi:MAG TPA: ribbon-helix-helix protein, CopG family [Intrasporangium sp.]|uniref:ribbon-helix-helix protein, CopG family n=1 Tax=Intrasporangium sp. TaxID=1925024 RepID=UPI002B4A703A|nr:ribbon-helix-helix protein, CopG family [Intrasporangium sp.]HKX67734.1 ribbon-helix-helix protein, CopG family [Intrasporangium sp.]
MSLMERRLQVLLDQDRYAKVEAEARASGRSVAAVIRDAIDLLFDSRGEAARRMESARRLLDLADLTGNEPPAGDWAETKRAMDDELAGRLER